MYSSYLISQLKVISVHAYKFDYVFQQREFEWVLNKEVHAVLNQLHTILTVI